MIEILAILMAIGFIVIYLLIVWKAIEARENLNKEIDRLIEEIRKSKEQ
jgi:hypothetical protein